MDPFSQTTSPFIPFSHPKLVNRTNLRHFTPWCGPVKRGEEKERERERAQVRNIRQRWLDQASSVVSRALLLSPAAVRCTVRNREQGRDRLPTPARALALIVARSPKTLARLFLFLGPGSGQNIGRSPSVLFFPPSKPCHSGRRQTGNKRVLKMCRTRKFVYLR